MAFAASGEVKEHVVPATLKNAALALMVSSVICSGPVPVFCIVTTLVTAARGFGIVNVKVLMPNTLARVALVAEVKLSVPDAATTVKVTPLLVPPGVVMVTVLAVCVALLKIENLAVTVVAFTTVMLETVTPVPETVIAVAPVRLVPERVTGITFGVKMVEPRTAEVGTIDVNVGV